MQVEEKEAGSESNLSDQLLSGPLVQLSPRGYAPLNLHSELFSVVMDVNFPANLSIFSCPTASTQSACFRLKGLLFGSNSSHLLRCWW